MGNLDGKFVDQDPFVLGTQIITARTNVKTDLNAIIAEANQIRATNTFLVSQNVGNSSAGGSVGSAVTSTAIGTVGAAQTTGEIGSGGQPCHIGITRIETCYGWKHIRHIKIGDVAITFDPLTGALSEGEVVATMQHQVERYCLIEFEDGHTTGVDERGAHKYWNGRDYLAIADMGATMHLVNGEWKPRAIVSRRIVNERVILYNFETQGFHNYIANRNAVSNAKNPFLNELERSPEAGE